MMVRLFIMKMKLNIIVVLHHIVKILMVINTKFLVKVICAMNIVQPAKILKQFGIQLKKKTSVHLNNFVHKLMAKFIREIQPV